MSFTYKSKDLGNKCPYSFSHILWATWTFLSCMLFTVPTLKKSPALCSLDFSFSVGCTLCKCPKLPAVTVPWLLLMASGLAQVSLVLEQVVVGVDRKGCATRQDIPGSLGCGKHDAVCEAAPTAPATHLDFQPSTALQLFFPFRLLEE